MSENKLKKELKTADIKQYRREYYLKNKQAIIDKVKTSYHDKADIRNRNKKIAQLENFDNLFNEIQELFKEKETKLLELKTKIDEKYIKKPKVEQPKINEINEIKTDENLNEPFFVGIMLDKTTGKYVIEIRADVYQRYGKPEIKIL